VDLYSTLFIVPHTPNLAILIFVNFVVSVPTLISKQPVLSPLRLSTPTLIIVIHSTSISLNSIVFTLFKTFLLVPLSKPLNLLILSLFWNLYIGWKLMNA